eukprot:CAMPEP_0196685186 /NCGR_PEP_ID=MMETSP1090-20130531/11051_1 /TAXON_ID=37098 /ORGANISM="Isochrysis sp, Strain CCMP1244" /LENGTH=172 /DNA_ID=CAMNT_0042023699 /DNA_START=584 /DNA_END=1100 /DNA_ORIENTATION=+
MYWEIWSVEWACGDGVCGRGVRAAGASAPTPPRSFVTLSHDTCTTTNRRPEAAGTRSNASGASLMDSLDSLQALEEPAAAAVTPDVSQDRASSGQRKVAPHRRLRPPATEPVSLADGGNTTKPPERVEEAIRPLDTSEVPPGFSPASWFCMSPWPSWPSTPKPQLQTLPSAV